MRREVMRAELQGMSGSLKFADATLRIIDGAIAEGRLPAWEEPEVLWAADYRNPSLERLERREILSDGTWRVNGALRPVEGEGPELAELIRRLLEERKQQEALDEHNDKMETATYLAEEQKEAGVSEQAAVWSTLESHRYRLEVLESSAGLTLLEQRDPAQVEENNAISRRLARVEEDLFLVRGQAAHVDEREAADFEAARIRLDTLARDLKAWQSTVYNLADVDAGPRIRSLEGKGAAVRFRLDQLNERISRLETGASRPAEDLPGQLTERPDGMDALQAVWKLWGPDGELRTRLADTLPPVDSLRSENFEGWFRQLRSELLALPDEVKS